MLAGMGAELNDINKTYNGSSNYTLTTDNINSGDEMIRRRFGVQPPQPQVYQDPMEPITYHDPLVQYIPQPTYNPQPIMQPTENRSDRINRLLGRAPQQEPQVQYIETPRLREIVEGVGKAIQPLVEALEDLAVLNGILVQRIEQLIKIVDPNAVVGEAPGNISEQVDNVDTFQEDIPEMEVYDPGVSMVLTEDEDTEEVDKPKRKRKTKA